MKTLNALVCVFFTFAGGSPWLEACWLPPPDVVWLEIDSIIITNDNGNVTEVKFTELEKQLAE